MNIIYNIKLTFNFVCLIHVGDKQELTEEDVQIIKKVFEDDVDPTLIKILDPETKKITFTQDQKNLYCAEAKSSSKQNESLPEKKEIHKIPID